VASSQWVCFPSVPMCAYTCVCPNLCVQVTLRKVHKELLENIDDLLPPGYEQSVGVFVSETVCAYPFVSTT
ncbi:unnamed protein product, partial [Closterium sp. NIES-53]